MQNPDLTTPLPRCFHLGHFSTKALLLLAEDAADPNLPILEANATKMEGLTTALKLKQEAYDASKYVIVEARVRLRFTDYFTDFGIGSLLNKVQDLEHQKAGPIFKQLAPNGRAALTRPFGQSQLDVLVDLETKLTELAQTWTPAGPLLATVTGMRQNYEAALQARADAWKTSRNLRLARNVAKAAFIKGYNEVSLALKAIYLDNKRMLELLFDDVAADVEKDLGDESQQDQPTQAKPTPAAATPAAATPPAATPPAAPPAPPPPAPTPPPPAAPGEAQGTSTPGAGATPGGADPGDPSG